MIILASGSPRRREMLDLLGVQYEVRRPFIDESLLAEERIDEAVRRLATAKSAQIVRANPDRWVLAADTLVALEGRPLGKPRDAQEARNMLRSLSGRRHRVLTGVAVQREGGPVLSEAGEAIVRFRELAMEEIDAYVASGEPLDRAGSYAIQGLGGFLVAEVVGEISTVVGLSLSITARLLTEVGIPHRLAPGSLGAP